GYKHAITPIMLKMACTIGGVHISRFTLRSFTKVEYDGARRFTLHNTGPASATFPQVVKIKR
ncbi:hypothetical protein CKO50_18535, partial [Pseudoalteromonas sp. HM-SA03]